MGDFRTVAAQLLFQGQIQPKRIPCKLRSQTSRERTGDLITEIWSQTIDKEDVNEEDLKKVIEHGEAERPAKRRPMGL